jgi:hypothetical protein
MKTDQTAFHLQEAAETWKEEEKLSVDLKPRTWRKCRCYKSGHAKVHSVLAQAGNASALYFRGARLTSRLGLRPHSLGF